MKRAILILLAIFFALPAISHAASVSIEPASGSFVAGEIFEVSVYLDTQGKSVNALDIGLQFPPAKIQVVSPSTGKSIMGVWTSPPKFNNQTGMIRLQGGIPGGINVSKGLIATMVFRGIGVGNSFLRFTSDSKVLENNGQATDILGQSQNGAFDIVLPPPLGPKVISDTHPDQMEWSQNSSVSLKWSQSESIEGFSYILNDIPLGVPDNISEGTKSSILYKNLPSGRYYFHIKSLRDSVWGGITHYAIKIDSAPPADFKINVAPSFVTSQTRPVLEFSTTDALSGISHYELKVIPLSSLAESNESLLFFEATSPFVMDLQKGTYSVVVRAYDVANNFKDVEAKIKIVPSFLSVIQSEGLQIMDGVIIPWSVAVVFGLFFIVLLFFAAAKTRNMHQDIHNAWTKKILPPVISEKIEGLGNLRHKYLKTILIFLIGAIVPFSSNIALAQSVDLNPPFVTIISKNISNQEIFYIGGKVDASGSDVIIYIQNTQSGETFSVGAVSDQKGDWFYRHSTFFSPGNYLIWTQAKLGDIMSPPSPQMQVSVRQTAIQFGATRISYEFFYFAMMVLFIILVVALVAYILFHWYWAKKKKKMFDAEIRSAEESIRRGFALLKQDISRELAFMHELKLSKELSAEEKLREEQLLKDLNLAESEVGKEIWEAEHFAEEI